MHSWKTRKANISPLKEKAVSAPRNWWYLIIIVLAILLWTAGESRIAASFDEVFSALNCTKINAFQTIAYYMLPNNHIYFNLLNKIPTLLITDPVLSGKIISGIAYCLVLCCTFKWFVNILGNCLWALLAVIPVALQFITWGFSFQSRGYECELLCGWLCFISLFMYVRKMDVAILRFNVFFCIVGIAIIPTFLYYYLAQLLFVTFLQLYTKSFQFKFWKYQLFVGIACFLCYLPALCFSGLHAFTGNKYVSSNVNYDATFFPFVTGIMKYQIDVCFSSPPGSSYVLDIILFFLPLFLLCMRSKENKLLACFYISMWLSFFAIATCMRRLPFSRNMNVLFSLTMAYTIYTLYSLIRMLADYIKTPVIRQLATGIVFALTVTMYAYYLYKDDLTSISSDLYGYDLSQQYDQFKNNVAVIPANSTIAFSDESFYWRYNCGKMQYRVSACANGNEDYYVLGDPDKLPADMVARYELIKKCGDYEIYKRH